jgi:integrase
MGQLLYGSGLRLMECLRLRVKDVDFSQQHIIVRDGKGFKDRVTLLPELLQPALHLRQHWLGGLLGGKKSFNLKCRLILPGKPQVILRLLVKPALSRSVKSH